MTLTYAELCAGYGGIGQAIESVLDARLAWYAENDAAPTRIMARHHPDVPNHGDITRTDWAAVEPVDILAAGFPCQPVSAAGKRRGEHDERWLWDDVARAVRDLRPGLVVLENVRGLLTARRGRLFGRVLGSLADLGYDTRWFGLRAADVGAAHGRWRVFIFATPAGARDNRFPLGVTQRPSPQRAWATSDRVDALLRTPTAQLAVNGGSQHPDRRRAGGHGPTLADEVEHLLPIPDANMGNGGRTRSSEALATVAHQANLNDLPRMLLPTPTAMDSKASGGAAGGPDVTLTDATVRRPQDWGKYAAAIRRHELIFGHAAPSPTELSPKGNQRLSPRFVEWLMMLPEGHVTATPGLSRNQQLAALGNGVVPAQCAAALSAYLEDEAGAVA